MSTVNLDLSFVATTPSSGKVAVGLRGQVTLQPENLLYTIQSVGTTAEPVDVGDVGVHSYHFIRNVSAQNALQLFADGATGLKPFAYLSPGQFAFFYANLAANDRIGVKAIGGSAEMEKLLFSVPVIEVSALQFYDPPEVANGKEYARLSILIDNKGQQLALSAAWEKEIQWVGHVSTWEISDQTSFLAWPLTPPAGTEVGTQWGTFLIVNRDYREPSPRQLNFFNASMTLSWGSSSWPNSFVLVPTSTTNVDLFRQMAEDWPTSVAIFATRY